MIRFMRKSPMIVASVFLLVQVWGLADYSTGHLGGSAPLGWLFALAIEAGIFGAFYFTRQNVTVRKERKHPTMNQRKDKQARIAALVVACFLMVVSGYLNTAKSLANLPRGYAGMDFVSALAMGVIPTVAASMLGFLQGNIDRLPFVQAKAAQHPLMMRVYALIEQRVTLLERRTSEAMQTTIEKVAKDATAKKYKCDYCHKPTTRYEKGAHMRQCAKNPKNMKKWSDK